MELSSCRANAGIECQNYVSMNIKLEVGVPRAQYFESNIQEKLV
jgi:hypothetical protein